VDTAPVIAKPRRRVFRDRPWSAAPDMEMMINAWTKTLVEKVYIAKLAVLISAPRIYTTQAGASSRPCRGGPLSSTEWLVLLARELLFQLAEQGSVLS